jgi:DNA-binding CsgD family transcriptional regulator/PAS domain-containing protein
VRRADERFEDHEIRYSQGLASASELRRDRCYADFLSPAQVAHSFSIKIPYGSSLPAYLAGSRSERKAAFEENEGKVLLTLAPHIRRALELHRRVAGSMAHSELVDSLPVGVVFANEDGHLLWWNRYADSIFQMRDGLRLGRAGFETARPREGERLAALVRQASTLGTRTLPGGGAMAISRPSLRRSYAVLVSPLKKGSGPLNQAVVAVLVVDPERSVPVGVEQRLALQFGLTPAEARVAARLLEGKTVGEAANELSVSLATARTHVRSLLNKTGTARQAELIRIFLSGPYLLDRDP